MSEQVQQPPQAAAANQHEQLTAKAMAPRLFITSKAFVDGEAEMPPTEPPPSPAAYGGARAEGSVPVSIAWQATGAEMAPLHLHQLLHPARSNMPGLHTSVCTQEGAKPAGQHRPSSHPRPHTHRTLRPK